MIQLHGTVLDTTEAFRFVKDTILSYGSILHILISEFLFQSTKLAHSHYEASLEAKCKLREDELKTKQTRELEDAQKRVLYNGR